MTIIITLFSPLFHWALLVEVVCEALPAEGFPLDEAGDKILVISRVWEAFPAPVPNVVEGETSRLMESTSLSDMSCVGYLSSLSLWWRPKLSSLQ